MSETLTNLIARVTDDSAERLVLSLLIAKELREEWDTRTESDGRPTVYKRFELDNFGIREQTHAE